MRPSCVALGLVLLCARPTLQATKEELQDAALKISNRFREEFVSISGFEEARKSLGDVYSSSSAYVEEADIGSMADAWAGSLQSFLRPKLQALVALAEAAELAAEEASRLNLTETGPAVLIRSRNASHFASARPGLTGLHVPVDVYEGAAEVVADKAWTGAAELVEAMEANKAGDSGLLRQAVATSTGVTRTYPGEFWDLEPGMGQMTMDLFDPRLRHWYLGATMQPRRVLFLLDYSGSAFGQTMRLIRITMVQALATLGPRDSLAAVWYNRRVGLVLHNCSSTFVPASSRNKRLLLQKLDTINASHVADFPKALNFSFLFLEDAERADGGDWAERNEQRLLLFLTDGTEEWAEDVLDSFAPVDQDGVRDLKVRIFSLAMGYETTFIPAAHWLACQGRGLYTSVNTMGVVPGRLREVFAVLSRPLAQYYRDLGSVAERPVTWTGPYLDAQGEGVLLTLSMPLLDNRLNASKQSFLGVAAVDIKVSSLLDLLEGAMGNPNVYGLGMRETGAVAFHPDYRSPEPDIQMIRRTACFVIPDEGVRGRSIDKVLYGRSTEEVGQKLGILDDLLSLDLGDVEAESEQLLAVRRAMLSGACDGRLYRPRSGAAQRTYTCRTLKGLDGKPMLGLSIALAAKANGRVLRHSEPELTTPEILRRVPRNASVFLPTMRACRGGLDFSELMSQERMAGLREWVERWGQCEGGAQTRRMLLDLASVGPWASAVLAPRADWNESCYSAPDASYIVPKAQYLLTDGGVAASPDRCASKVPNKARLRPRRALFWDEVEEAPENQLTFSFDDASNKFVSLTRSLRLPDSEYLLGMVGVELWRSDIAYILRSFEAADPAFLSPCFMERSATWKTCYLVTRSMEVVWGSLEGGSLPTLPHLAALDPSLFADLVKKAVLLKESRLEQQGDCHLAPEDLPFIGRFISAAGRPSLTALSANLWGALVGVLGSLASLLAPWLTESGSAEGRSSSHPAWSRAVAYAENCPYAPPSTHEESCILQHTVYRWNPKHRFPHEGYLHQHGGKRCQVAKQREYEVVEVAGTNLLLLQVSTACDDCSAYPNSPTCQDVRQTYKPGFWRVSQCEVLGRGSGRPWTPVPPKPPGLRFIHPDEPSVCGGAERSTAHLTWLLSFALAMMLLRR